MIISKIMAATDLYLIRGNNLTWAKIDAVLDVYLSGTKTAYAAVTGNAGTGVVTITGSTLADGMTVTFTSLTGGAGLSTGLAYFVINASGATCKLSLTEGGSAVALGTNITAGSVIVTTQQMRVWSSEFRDQFTTSISGQQFTAAGAVAGSFSSSFPGLATNVEAETATTATPSAVSTVTPTISTNSDEVAHNPLRQTFLNKSFWLFDRGASATPRYLPSEYMEGDIIATNPPQTA